LAWDTAMAMKTVTAMATDSDGNSNNDTELVTAAAVEMAAPKGKECNAV
jgi:hypothetical protein